jgi:hypothetical protein
MVYVACIRCVTLFCMLINPTQPSTENNGGEMRESLVQVRLGEKENEPWGGPSFVTCMRSLPAMLICMH